MRSTVVAVGAGLVAALCLATWPLPARLGTEAFGLPGMEAVDHLWALWAASQDGPLIIDSALLNYPSGYRWVVVDALNLVWFVPGDAVGGPALGWNLIAVGNLMVAALAAGLWARQIAPDRPLAPGAAAALAIPLAPLAGSLFTGMSEVLTMGWAALALLALWRVGAASSIGRIVLAGGVCGLTAWGGPYTSLYAVFAAIPLTIAMLWRTRGGVALPLVGVGGIAALIAAPVGRAVLFERPAGLPGTSSDLPLVLAEPGAAKNLMLGADPLALVWPIPGVEPTHAVFLGTVLVVLGGVAAVQRRQAALGAAILLLCVLGLGFFVQHRGALVTWNGQALGLPALWLSMLIEPLGRAVRWHRAVVLAGILLAGLAGVGAVDLARRSRWPAVVGCLLVTLGCAEALWRAPLAWPRPMFSTAPPSGIAQLTPGPILELPLPRFGSGDPRQLRSPSLLWQVSHGQPLGGNPRQPGEQFRDPNVAALARAVLAGDQAAPTALAGLGFVWVVVHNARDVRRVQRVLGEPDVHAESVWAWRLSRPSTPPTPRPGHE